MELEARAKVEDIMKFRKKLEKLDAKLTSSYSFTDYLFQPHRAYWDMNQQSMKIRAHENGKVISRYSIMRWHDSIKETMFKKDTEEESLKSALDKMLKIHQYEKVAEYSRKGEVYRIDGFTFVMEEINRLGYMVEIEADEKEKINKRLKLLELEKIAKSVPRMIKEAVEG